MSAGVVVGILVGLAGLLVVVARESFRRLDGRRAGSGGRVRGWSSVWLDGERIVAEGVADDAIVTERFVIMLNGRPVKMIVLQIDPPRWQAQDVGSCANRARGIRVRGSVRA